ncbi:type IV pilus modification PilV family protein [Pontiella agarivorans]|uniref:Prepilin-type N-terminal cleavage/methylation domain-containing protein n=1 Tax=Pontiella agarivorans TaxID=3038953 RepID=A0ABU5MYM5_9BACT|nr:prepilin-type N-terminal cleavage/methylation domain-containing protein [Pontiella agarivorans]MDZ8119285.1 prepilin-type N-terminal cleavage/methylation domain-containing protein [Pontiella agarivorans]
MKICSTAKSRTRRGFSLIEIMVAVLILGVLAIGGAALMQRTGITVTEQKHKRIALETANRRLEQLRAQPYEFLNDGPVGAVRYASVRYADGSYRIVQDQPEETVSINGSERPVYVELVRFSETVPEREFVQATVYVEYRDGETVSLRTILR